MKHIFANTNAGRGIATATIQSNGHTPNGHDKPPEVPAKPAAPRAPSPIAIQEEEPEPAPIITEKSIEAPKDLHPTQREGDKGGRSTPLPRQRKAWKSHATP